MSTASLLFNRHVIARATLASLLAWLLASCLPSRAQAAIYISQYYDNGGSEWIEIYNSGTQSVDLSTYRLGTWNNTNNEGWKSSASPNASGALSGIIAAGGTFTVAGNATTLPVAEGNANVSAFNGFGFTGDDSVVLYTGVTYNFANVVDAMGFTSVNLIPSNTSRNRDIAVASGVNTDFNAANWTAVSTTTAATAMGQPTNNLRLGTYKLGGISQVWDANAGGAGTGGSGNWSTANALWSPQAAGGANLKAWDNTTTINLTNFSNAYDTALFGGSAGTVTLTSDIRAGGLLFTVGGYMLTRAASEILTLGGNNYIEVTNSAHAATISNPITATGQAIKKVGGGTLNLHGASTSAGGTQVLDGTLNINGSLSGDVSVDGGLLGGTGEIGGNVTVNALGSIGAGNSIESLEVGGSYSQFGEMIVEIAGGGIQGSGAGTLYDLIVVDGAATLQPGSVVDVNLLSFSPAPGSYFDVLVAADINGLSNSLAGITFDFTDAPLSSPHNAWQASIVSVDGGEVLRLTVTPEPSSLVSMSVIVATALAWALRRQRRAGKYRSSKTAT
jgi:hypothetical protein